MNIQQCIVRARVLVQYKLKHILSFEFVVRSRHLRGLPVSRVNLVFLSPLKLSFEGILQSLSSINQSIHHILLCLQQKREIFFFYQLLFVVGRIKKSQTFSKKFRTFSKKVRLIFSKKNLIFRCHIFRLHCFSLTIQRPALQGERSSSRKQDRQLPSLSQGRESQGNSHRQGGPQQRTDRGRASIQCSKSGKSINQSNHSILHNQSINQSIQPTLCYTINQSINQSEPLCTTRLINQSINQTSMLSFTERSAVEDGIRRTDRLLRARRRSRGENSHFLRLFRRADRLFSHAEADRRVGLARQSKGRNSGERAQHSPGSTYALILLHSRWLFPFFTA